MKIACNLVVVLMYFMHLTVLASESHIQVQKLTIDSQIMNEKRDIVVFLPEGYGTESKRFPVLYMTDGDIQGPHTAGSLDYLAKFDQVPAMIVVGIVNPRVSRERDLTLAEVKQKSGQLEGADRFLNFVEHEVIPFIKKRYKTLNYQAISGTSHGGQFGIYSMIKRPELFDGVIAISPSLYWNNRQLLGLSETALKKQSFKGSLFVSVANEEPIMTESYKKLVELTQQYPNENLKIANQVFSQESHNSTALLGQYYGLKHLYSDWVIPDSPQTLADLLEIYTGRSNLIGTPIVIPEDRANGYGQWLQYLNRQEDALTLFEWNRKTYPDSLSVHKALIIAYLHFNMVDEAKMTLKEALKTLKWLSVEQTQELRALASDE